MPIVAIAAARNEQDIIEAFVRHTLSYCDHLILMNHGSTDATSEILQSLKNEGLPLQVLWDSTIGILQAAFMTRMMKMAALELGADWIVCLDSDEFLQGPVIESLQALKPTEEPYCVRVPLENYVAQPDNCPDIVNPVERLTHREAVDESRERRFWSFKIIVPRELALREGAFIEKGNHLLTINGFEAPYRKIKNGWLAHFPIRQPSQFASKLVSRIFQKHRFRASQSNNSDHYEKPYRKMRANYSAFVKDFCSLRASWVGAGGGEAPLTIDPAEYRGGPLCHTPARHDTDQLIKDILDLGENLARLSPGGDSQQDQAVVSLSLCDENGLNHSHLQKVEGNTSNFIAVHLPLEGLKASHRLDLGIRGEPGILEVGKITIVFAEGEPRHFEPATLRRVLSVNEGGIMVCASAFIQILMTSRPVILTLIENELASGNKPVEAIIEVRFIGDSRLLAMAVFDPNTLSQLRAAPPPPSADWSPRYSLGREIRFDCLGEGRLFAKSGWGKPEAWGTWTEGSCSTLFFRMEEPTQKALSLRLFARRRPTRKDDAGKGSVMRVKVLVDGQYATTWELDNDKYRWLSIPIPGNRLGRRALTASFEIEQPLPTGLGGQKDEASPSKPMSLGVKAGSLVQPSLYRDAANACHRLWHPLSKWRRRMSARNKIAMGEEIRFDDSGRGIWFAKDGWGQAQPWGTPFEGPEASLSLQLPRRGTSDLLLRIFVRPTEQKTVLEGLVRVEINGKAATSWKMDSSQPQCFEIMVPRERIAHRELIITLKAKEPILGFGLERLALIEAPGVQK